MTGLVLQVAPITGSRSTLRRIGTANLCNRNTAFLRYLLESRRENLADVSQRLFREDQDRKEAKRNQELRERFVKYKRLCAQLTDNAVDANTQTYDTRSRLSTPRGSTSDSRETEDKEYDSVRSSSPTMDANTIEHKYQVIRMRGGADTEPPHSPSSSDEDTNVQDNPGPSISENTLPPNIGGNKRRHTEDPCAFGDCSPGLRGERSVDLISRMRLG